MSWVGKGVLCYYEVGRRPKQSARIHQTVVKFSSSTYQHLHTEHRSSGAQAAQKGANVLASSLGGGASIGARVVEQRRHGEGTGRHRSGWVGGGEDSSIDLRTYAAEDAACSAEEVVTPSGCAAAAAAIEERQTIDHCRGLLPLVARVKTRKRHCAHTQ